MLKYFLDFFDSIVGNGYLSIPEGAFMYPLYIENGAEVRKTLQVKKIFIPTLWLAVFIFCDEDELEYDMAKIYTFYSCYSKIWN